MKSSFFVIRVTCYIYIIYEGNGEMRASIKDMNKLIEKIKNIFKRKELGTSERPKDKTLSNAMWRANDIGRSIRESEKLKIQKNLWRNIFH